MNCEQFEQAWIDDDPALRTAAERHAAACPKCRRMSDLNLRLAHEVARWKEETDSPPPELQARIAAELRTPRQARPRWYWAAAAAVLLGATILLPVALQRQATEPLELAIDDTERIQQQYAAAIANLERQAREALEHASDLTLPPQQAARLLAYRDQLAHLDTVIAEVEEFLDQNPGHSGGHKVMLAAYKEKDEVLKEILQFSRGEST